MGGRAITASSRTSPPGASSYSDSAAWRLEALWVAKRVRAGRSERSMSSSTSESSRPDSNEIDVATELVRRIEKGDPIAEARLVERYSRGLLYMLQRTTRNPFLAEDLHQETFRIVLERLRTRGLGQPEKLTGFIHRTARNLFIANYRKALRRQTQNDDSAIRKVVDPAPNQLGSFLDKEEADLVRQLISELKPDRDRQLLLRFYIAEEEKEQICRDLGLSSLHFNRVLFRARQRFKDLLERFEKRQNLEQVGLEYEG